MSAEISQSDSTPSSWAYLLRVTWILLRLILAYSLAQEFQPFFYQAF